MGYEDDIVRRVRTPSEERRYARERARIFKKLSSKIGNFNESAIRTKDILKRRGII